MPENESHYSLQNQFLVAMPQLGHSYFGKSVTYLCRHTEEGALGIVINKPMRVKITELFEELDIECAIAEQELQQQHLLAGGPVESSMGFVIHDAGMRWESSMEVTDSLAISTSKEILKDIAAGSGPSNYLIALGCAGWEAGQLEREISENTWLTTPASSELLFSRDYGKKPRAAAALLGIDLDQLSPHAGHS